MKTVLNPQQKPLMASFQRWQAQFDVKCFAVALLGILANVFFLDAPVGFGWALFHGVAILVMGWFNPVLFKSKTGKMIWGLMLGLTLALLLQPNPLTIVLSDIGWLLLMLLSCGVKFSETSYLTVQTFLWGLIGWTRCFIDLGRVLKLIQSGSGRLRRQFLFVLPISLLCIFFLLFTQANPIFQKWLEWIDWALLLEWLALHRILFFLWIVVMAWMVLRPRLFRVSRKGHGGEVDSAINLLEQKAMVMGEWLFSKNSLLLTLVAFNLLFSLQNGMDLWFLWSGQTLPDGMTYAEYAHRGAYPLILTALLAGGFVMFILQPGSEREQHKAMVNGVLLWLFQNVILTASSIWRLALYVDAYSLTHWRVASFIWMGLVLAGLVLLAIRVAMRMDNVWLLRQNWVMLGATLYLCCFINWNFVIAMVNVQTCLEYRGKGPSLDWDYLSNDLGEDSVLALQYFSGSMGVKDTSNFSKETLMQANFHWEIARRKLVDNLEDWRGWTLNRGFLNHLLLAEEKMSIPVETISLREPLEKNLEMNYNREDSDSKSQSRQNETDDNDWKRDPEYHLYKK
jgi:hypothetical protein